jgi:TRAP-type C4-dicarboxylate transport system permease small subunit
MASRAGPPPAPPPRARFSPAGAFDRALDLLATSGFAVMLVVTILQVVFRYALTLPLAWTEEAARVLFVLTVFFGIAIAIREREHVVVDFLFNRLPPRGRLLAGLAFDAVIVLLLAVIARGTWVLAVQNWDSRLLILDWLTNGQIFLAQLVAIVIMIWYVLQSMRRAFGELRSGRLRAGRAPRPEGEL